MTLNHFNIFLIYLLALLPNSDRFEFERAQKTGTIAAWERYIAAGPEPTSKYLPTAMQRLDKLRFNEAVKMNTREAWLDFLHERPARPQDAIWTERGRHADEALGRYFAKGCQC